MLHLDTGAVVLFVIALLAAFVNGALGYGFSSLTVPVALLFFSNRILSPALVLVELAVNTWIVVLNRKSLSIVRRRVFPIILGLIPGILVGSYLLTNGNPAWLKFGTYVVLLPLILSQAAGFRRPIHSERAAGIPLGMGVGTLYATTTISGPPLALMFNNQGLDQEEFRAALGTVRVVETTLTAVAYGFLGLYRSKSVELILPIAPAVLLGLPLGAYFIKYVRTETFRRICMSFDAWIVGFGLSRSIIDLNLLSAHAAYVIWCAIILFDLYLLYRYFLLRRVRGEIVPLLSSFKSTVSQNISRQRA
jgi:uncharacterized membrane protein YfcA